MSRGAKIALIGFGAVGAVVVLASLFAVLFTKPYRIPSASMEPTLEIGDRILVRRGGYDPKRGDIVVINPPRGSDLNECGVPNFEPAASNQACPRPTEGESEQAFVERIVAVGGDRLRIQGGAAVIDGKRQDEDGVRLDESCPVCNLPREITIPDGHVFLMGDNRGQSADSREWGPVPEDSIVGPVMVRYWPPGRWGSP